MVKVTVPVTRCQNDHVACDNGDALLNSKPTVTVYFPSPNYCLKLNIYCDGVTVFKSENGTVKTKVGLIYCGTVTLIG